MALCVVAIMVFLAVAMTFAWAVAVRTGKSGFIDATWSFAVGVAAVSAALWPLRPDSYGLRQICVAAFAAVWSARLGSYIFSRSVSHGDDPRYADLKRQWGEHANRELFIFLQIQGVAGWALAGAAGLAAHAPFGGLRPQDGLALLVFVAALSGETVADRQMAAFRADPHNRDRVCDVGLWGWSRHPNYFFEWLSWCAYPLIAVDLTGAYPAGWLSLAAPVLMYVLLAHVSGVPPLEAHMARTRPAAFADYRRRVSTFWPTPPARGKVRTS